MALWGQMATGGGHSRLEESMGVVGVSVMTQASFISTEHNIGGVVEGEICLRASLKVGKRRSTWLKRGVLNMTVCLLFVLLLMEGHSYNANSGVGIILGKATGKRLHIGVQNKFCTSCS